MSEYIRSSQIVKAAKLIGAMRMMQYGLRPYPGATMEGLLEEAEAMTGQKVVLYPPTNGLSEQANAAIVTILDFVKRVEITNR